MKQMNILVRENVESQKMLRESIQAIWDTMQRQDLRILGIEVGTYQLEDPESIFYKIIKENIFI